MKLYIWNVLCIVSDQKWMELKTNSGPASLQDTLFSNSCLLMTRGDWHLHYKPIRTEQQGCLRAEVDPPGSVDQSDLSSGDSIIIIWEVWKEARHSLQQEWAEIQM